MERTDRLAYLDMAKGIGIILVLFGHLEYTGQYVRVWISSFHMPLFFVIAGITLSLGRADHSDAVSRIRRRARGLLIPYAWFSAAYFVIDIGNMYLGKIDGHTFIVNAISSITFYGKSVLWFITALFLSQVMLILLQKRINDRGVILISIVVAAVAYFCSLALTGAYEAHSDSLLITSVINMGRTITRAGIVLIFVTLVYYGKRYADHIGFFEKPGYIRLITGFAFLAVNIPIALVNWSVDTNNMVLNNPFLYYAGSITGSLSIILLCSAVRDIPPLSYIGRNSLVIMAIHLDFYVLWAGLQVGKLVYRAVPFLPALTITTVIVTLILGCIASYIVERFFPFVLGRKRSP